MGYFINGIQIPNPKRYTHNFVETVAQNELIFGKTTKRFQLRKRQHVLEYQNLTQDQVTSIASLYIPGTPVSFQVTEANLQVGPIDVFMDITERQYVQSAHLWRENIKIGLMEIT